MRKRVVVFDFLSHAAMHLPFNEGYLRTVRAAFKDDAVLFCAKAEHIAALRPLLSDDPGIGFAEIDGFSVPYGLSRHNPIGGSMAAHACIRTMRQMLQDGEPRLVTVLGADANLYQALRREWTGPQKPWLHVVLHNHVAAAVQWRSRNPIVRAFDMRTVLQRPLPARMRLIALELGIADAVTRLAPKLAGAVDTLEHPILTKEWREPKAPHGSLRIGFLGHASAAKGFDAFAAWAKRFAGAERSFHAIGLASPEARTMDLSGLATPPAAKSVPRDIYMSNLASCDLICLPLSPSYDYVASGSVIDAIATLKPLFSVTNNSLRALAARYGEFGLLAPDMTALEATIGSLTCDSVAGQLPTWIQNLRSIRDARTPEALAGGYSALVA